jgi:hypothetical protein
LGEEHPLSRERAFLPLEGEMLPKKIGINSGRGGKNNNIMKTFKKVLTTLLFLITVTLLTINLALAQTPPPPNGGDTPSQGGNTPVGGGAPIAGGIGILLVLGAAYGGKKVYQVFKK